MRRRSGRGAGFWADLGLLLMAMAPLGYIIFFYEQVTDYDEYGFLDFAGMALAFSLAISLLVALKRAVGWVLVTIVCLFLAVARYQNILPGLLFGKGYAWDRLTYAVYVPGEGIFGVPLGRRLHHCHRVSDVRPPAAEGRRGRMVQRAGHGHRRLDPGRGRQDRGAGVGVLRHHLRLPFGQRRHHRRGDHPAHDPGRLRPGVRRRGGGGIVRRRPDPAAGDGRHRLRDGRFPRRPLLPDRAGGVAAGAALFRHRVHGGGLRGRPAGAGGAAPKRVAEPGGDLPERLVLPAAHRLDDLPDAGAEVRSGHGRHLQPAAAGGR